MRKLLLSGLLLIFSICAFAQAEYTLGYMRGVYQSTYVNPASVPNYKVSVGIPVISSVQANILNTGFVFNDVYAGRKDTNSMYDLNKLLSRMKDQNLFQIGTNIDLFHVHVKIKNSFISFNVTDKIDYRFSFTKDLVTFGWKGNASDGNSLVGKSADFTHLNMDMTHWREYTLGFVKEEKEYDLGIRLKFLQGMSNIQTINKNTSLGTGPTMYELNTSADLQVNTAGIASDSSGNFNFPKDGNGIKNYLLNFDNPGFAMDLGYTRKVTSKFKVSLAINNIGFISWNNNTSNYAFKGNYAFSGMDVVRRLINQDTTVFSVASYGDSVKNSYKYKYSQNTYFTWLVPQLYLTGSYDLLTGTHSLRAHGTFYMDYYKVVWAGFALGGTYELGKILGLTVTYSARYNRWDNLGVGLSLRILPPVQIYVATDNLMAAFKPYEHNFFNIRTGINLVFGNNKVQDKQPY
ncbi:MAG: hypothetical protein K2Q22_15235 [Cytophagales bacterium]|nr:hypothetical protein [Cytophagales bacterium]